MKLRLAPCTVSAARAFVKRVHRGLPKVQGAMWAVQVCAGEETRGVALVGNPVGAWADRTLAVLRVAVVEGTPNACSMLYGACSRAARAMGADNLVTYTHADEHGASLRASGWVYGGTTAGGEHDRPNRPRLPAIDPFPKNRWWAPWSLRARCAA